MTIFQAIILGIIQGVTEFLPISSSAHLVIVPFLFNWQIPEEQVFPFDVLVQVGTLVAVIIYFRKEIWRLIVGFFRACLERRWDDDQFRLGINLVLASIPAGILGLAFNDLIESFFHQPGVTGIFLLVTALILFIAERLGKRQNQMEAISKGDAILIGLAQAFSMLPGISRSGATISTGMLRNLKREDAARFSFLMSIPVMAMAGLMSSLDLVQMPNLNTFLPVMLVGFLVAGVVGYLAIHWLLKFLKTKPLYIFSIYCTVVGILIIVLYYG